jgi:hypothetical protein
MLVQLKKPAENSRKRPVEINKEQLINRIPGVSEGYGDKKKQLLNHIQDNVEGTHHHTNYLEYLQTAWCSHYGVVMTPDIMWHTLLSELVLIVGENPEKYASLFTTTPEQKQTVIVVSGSLVEMPLHVLIEAVKPLIPTNTDVFLPDFSTTTERSRMARYASFCDMVSPYYNYMMMLCGIPYIDVRGTDEDWQKVLDCWGAISATIPGHEEYFSKTTALLKRILIERNNSAFWQDMFHMEPCGSGSQVEVEGWLSDFFRIRPRVRYVSNYSTHLAKVCYKQINTNKDYEMFHGILSSRLENDLLIPEFGHIIFHRPKAEVENRIKDIPLEAAKV